MLTMNKVSKYYRTGKVQTHALREFSLQVDEGEFIAVTGPSGSGKTTFLNIAGMLESYSDGEYLLDGINVGKLSDSARADLRNQKIGFIFQGFNLIPDLNIFENIELPLRYRGVSSSIRKQKVMDSLEKVGLASRIKHLPQQLSGGQQQRVAIARALVGEPRFLLADEPTGNLDSLMARQVMELLEEINRKGSTIVMVTHDPELAQRAPRNIQIVDGQIADFSLYSKPDALLKEPSVEV